MIFHTFPLRTLAITSLVTARPSPNKMWSWCARYQFTTTMSEWLKVSFGCKVFTIIISDWYWRDFSLPPGKHRLPAPGCRPDWRPRSGLVPLTSLDSKLASSCHHQHHTPPGLGSYCRGKFPLFTDRVRPTAFCFHCLHKATRWNTINL